VPPPEPRDPKTRKADTLAKLREPNADVWVATAAGDPYLVPLSLAWIDERAVIAVQPGSRTARNITEHGRARLGLGPTRDVVIIDTVLDRVTGPDDAPIADGFAAQADWDPRDSPGYVYLVLRPERIQAWRESNELPGRTLMRDGSWVV
jgi:hypothetical protein